MVGSPQILMSISVSLGGLMTLSSYNKFDNNIHRDAWIIGLANSATSVFAGFVVFAILGFMSAEYGYDARRNLTEVQKLQEVNKDGGPALFFVTFPEVISKVRHDGIYLYIQCACSVAYLSNKGAQERVENMTYMLYLAGSDKMHICMQLQPSIPSCSQMPGQQVWSVLFFLMVITVGLDSMFGMVETIATAVNDALGLHGKTHSRYRMLVTFCVCLVGFLCGLSMVTQGGIQMLGMIDETVTKWLVPVAFVEARILIYQFEAKPYNLISVIILIYICPTLVYS